MEIGWQRPGGVRHIGSCHAAVAFPLAKHASDMLAFHERRTAAVESTFDTFFDLSLVRAKANTGQTPPEMKRNKKQEQGNKKQEARKKRKETRNKKRKKREKRKKKQKEKRKKKDQKCRCAGVRESGVRVQTCTGGALGVLLHPHRQQRPLVE
eukprot:2436993-Rhodomonas_salina.1